eukprot:CAMPEP_0117530260 /NCGR_PEP_ID=MMETSP0784-20121206/38251_2 /TAXON_ID=39447 /ORGANISM="" /LENGTH=118 /DNA_ID=CAMNT_0005326597 /DNA_START=47 /DNA_END=400 /DNA_ORIENTATION=-
MTMAGSMTPEEPVDWPASGIAVIVFVSSSAPSMYPMMYLLAQTRAESLWAISSKSVVTSLPAKIVMTSPPPGCSSRKSCGNDSTRFLRLIQQSFSELCLASSFWVTIIRSDTSAAFAS